MFSCARASESALFAKATSTATSSVGRFSMVPGSSGRSSAMWHRITGPPPLVPVVPVVPPPNPDVVVWAEQMCQARAVRVALLGPRSSTVVLGPLKLPAKGDRGVAIKRAAHLSGSAGLG